MELQPNDFRRMSVEEFDTAKLLAHASRQAKERGYEKFPIVDVDSHHYENESMPEILEYLDDPVLKQIAFAGDLNEDESNPECPITATYHPISLLITNGGLAEFKPTTLSGEYRTWILLSSSYRPSCALSWTRTRLPRAAVRAPTCCL